MMGNMDNSGPSQTIVIVEDNPALSEIYKTRLELIGYRCVVAQDGIAALYHIQKETPDLVLLDIMIPNVSGDQILTRMRTNDWGKNVPVVIISNLNESEAPPGLRQLGIVDYLIKANLSDDQIDKIVNKILKTVTTPVPAPNEPKPQA